MRRPRFHLSTLMAAVAVVAVTLGALVNYQITALIAGLTCLLLPFWLLLLGFIRWDNLR